VASGKWQVATQTTTSPQKVHVLFTVVTNGKICFFSPNCNNYHPRIAQSNNINNTNGNNNNNQGSSSTSNNNSNTPSSHGDQHHFERVSDSGIKMDWSDNFLFTLQVELDPAEISDTGSVSSKPTMTPLSSKEDVCNDDSKNHDLVPSTIMLVETISDAKRSQPIVALFNSDGSDIMINGNAIPKDAMEMIDTKKSFSTTAGDLHTMATIKLKRIIYPNLAMSTILVPTPLCV
jgi:hypothetical protein